MDTYPVPLCTGPHKPYQLRTYAGQPSFAMSRQIGQPMPYGYTRWRYVHFISGRNFYGQPMTCGHYIWRMER